MLDKEDLLAISQLIQENNKMIFERMDAKIDASAEETRRHFNVVIETQVIHDIKLIAEGHQQILDRLPEADKVRDLESRITTLERIVQMQRQELNALKGA